MEGDKKGQSRNKIEYKNNRKIDETKFFEKLNN